MIKECIEAKTGIQFDMEYLRNSLYFDPEKKSEIEDKDTLRGIVGAENVREIKYTKVNDQTRSDKGPNIHVMITAVALWAFYELIIKLSWSLLELVPLLAAYQDHRGNWFRRRM